MTANVQPIWSRSPNVDWAAAALTLANTAMDGTGTTNLIWTADASNGGICESIKWTPIGTNVASVGRIFVNNGNTPATPANNALFKEISLGAITLSQIAAQVEYEMFLNRKFDLGFRIYGVLGTAVAAGWMPIGFGGNY